MHSPLQCMKPFTHITSPDPGKSPWRGWGEHTIALPIAQMRELRLKTVRGLARITEPVSSISRVWVIVVQFQNLSPTKFCRPPKHTVKYSSWIRRKLQAASACYGPSALPSLCAHNPPTPTPCWASAISHSQATWPPQGLVMSGLPGAVPVSRLQH